MHPILFRLGTLTVYSWGFMVALGFAAGILVAFQRARKEGLSPEDIMDLSMWAIISALIGARSFYVIGFYSEFISNPLSVFYVWEGGMVFYGGLIFSMAAIGIMVRRKKLPLLKVLDIAAPTAAIGYSIGRIGCFLRGCCYGVKCDLPWGVHFPDVAGLVHPTQIYSSIAGLLIFIVLVIIRERKKYDGQVFFWGLMFYCVYRFIIEFFREYSIHVFGLTQSQWITVALLLAILLFKMFSMKPRRVR